MNLVVMVPGGMEFSLYIYPVIFFGWGYGIFFIYLSSNIFWISLHNLFNESFKWRFYFSALAAMNMIGAERKQTKTFCVHTQQLCQPGCFTI